MPARTMGLSLSNEDPIEAAAAMEIPFFSLYNERIGEILDAVDRLRDLKVTKEGIQLPTIVVVGDQSSGKSSVLESLAGISLPRGQGICTRVPLIMRLQGSHYRGSEPEFYLEYQGKTVPTSEQGIPKAINTGTDEIAGKQKGVSDNPITLVVKKRGVPDLTLVDLPGITRVPVHGQPEDIYEQISKIIMEYITPKETIILNVLSATVDFPTCESIRMSRAVDKSGERTLAVVTKADKAPEGLLEKVTADDVNIGLGYVCVRNRIGTESYEEARAAEASLFEAHPLLSMIDKSMVGIPVLAQKLVKIQASIIGKCLPEIIKKIDEKHTQNVSELNTLPRKLNNIAEAMEVFVKVIGSAKESLARLLLRGEYDEFLDDKTMHCPARIVELLDEYSQQLHYRSSSLPRGEYDDKTMHCPPQILELPDDLPQHCSAYAILPDEYSQPSPSQSSSLQRGEYDEYSQQLRYKSSLAEEESSKNTLFLMEEIAVLEESSRLALPNFLPRPAFRTILKQKLKGVAQTPFEFTRKVWNYIEGVVIRILVGHSESYPQLQTSCRRAAYNLITKMRERSYSYVQEMVEMETIADYTSNPEYMNTWHDLMKYQEPLLQILNGNSFNTQLEIPGFDRMEVLHLKVLSKKVEQAFDMKMRVTAYWKIVMLRLVDNLALHLLISMKNLVNEEMEAEIVKEFMGGNGGGLERLFEESTAVANKREKLNGSINLLKESKDVLAQVMDRIALESVHGHVE
ncbi:hypothetical protein Sjap_018119 [Stephania japonica]|uniref:Dynamin-related protein 4C-like n=1 Tax=Stephania japonica TaxID=461633 RepID=A0AAP0I7G2_9MAGN